MKINTIKIGATIATGQYQNMQPSIELSDVDIKEGTEIGVSFVKDLFARFSEKGALNEKEVIQETRTTITTKSFNEDIDIEVEPIGHTYSHKGKDLTPVTIFIDKFYKKFDSDKMSEVTAKSWGVDQTELKDLWNENGNLSSSFGNVVHNAIEFYLKFRELGEEISEHKGLDYNYALPKHPVLRAIIEGYIAIETSKGEVIPEVLLTSTKNGLCGRADSIEIVNLKKKICRVGEIKVNIGSEEIDRNMKASAPFEKLPANKLTKYQIQDSVYANMLQEAGWTVEGVDIYVYENEWKHYPVDVLQVIN